MTVSSVTLNGILNNPGNSGDHDNATRKKAVEVIAHFWSEATVMPKGCQDAWRGRRGGGGGRAKGRLVHSIRTSCKYAAPNSRRRAE